MVLWLWIFPFFCPLDSIKSDHVKHALNIMYHYTHLPDSAVSWESKANLLSFVWYIVLKISPHAWLYSIDNVHMNFSPFTLWTVCNLHFATGMSNQRCHGSQLLMMFLLAFCCPPAFYYFTSHSSLLHMIPQGIDR